MDLLVNHASSFLTYVLPFLIILTVIVFVHELGHYLAARHNGVRVEVFSIGFGRELFGHTDRHGTRWRFSLIPLGGYVKMFGEMDTVDAGAKGRPLSPEERAVSFLHKRLGQRAVIIAAGPVMNFVFAVLIFTLVFMTMGEPVTPPVMGEVKAGSAAEAAGVRWGDRFVAINGRAIEQFADIQQAVHLSNGAPLEIRLVRAGAEQVMTIVPQMAEGVDYLGNVRRMPVLGVGVNPDEPTRIRHHGPFSALVQALHETFGVVRSTLVAVGQMIVGVRDTGEVSGILRIAHFSGLAMQKGVIIFIMFIAILSINLGLINLFPIPFLDGGYLLFCAIEGVRGRPLTERTQEYGLRIGLVLVFGLMFFATWNDFVQLKVWDFLVNLVS
ncbi:MAG: zinc metalloprotease [Rhodospirillaceae bacterium]|nr:MAG: zinc metalloprotease [Rhodospirillaceae bacterium]